MREIKFRAWLKKEKIIVPVQELLLGPGAVCITHWIKGNKYSSRSADEFELMQFTGLKDKNGKEIFEEDIVKIDGAAKLGQIVFRDGYFGSMNNKMVVHHMGKSTRLSATPTRIANYSLLPKQKRRINET